MRDPFPSNNNAHPPGKTPPDSQDDSIEFAEIPKIYHPDTGKVLQKVFIGLLVIGLVLGGFMAVGVITLMNKAGLFGVPPVEKKSN